MEGPWEIETACLGIRPFNPGDKDELAALMRDSEFAHTVEESLREDGEARELVRRWVERSGEPWAVVMKNSGELAGVLGGAQEHDESSFTISVLYVMRVARFEQGYAQEALNAALPYAADRLGVARSDSSRAAESAPLSLRGRIVKHVHGASVLGFEFTVGKRHG